MARQLLASLVLAAAVPASLLGQPMISINGQGTSDNNGVANVKKLTPLEIELTGTPGAPFSVMLSGNAFVGTGGEPDVDNGFYLDSWAFPGAFESPIHPVFDGIGLEFIRNKINRNHLPPGVNAFAPSEFLTAVPPSPVFRFDSEGKFVLSGLVPSQAFLVNNTPSVSFGNPIVVDLESTSSTIALHLQVVELDLESLPANPDITIGNGIRVIFDKLSFPGTVNYSEGQDTNQNTVTVAQRQTLGRLVDPDLSDDDAFPQQIAPDFSGDFAGSVDFWMISLAGTHELINQSLYANAPSGAGIPPNPDNNSSITDLHSYSSGPEFLAGTQPTRNNENIEFPRIVLPGGREIFHWRRENPLGDENYGFGVLFRDSNTWRNLTPESVQTFPGTPTVSPWEFEVAVSPDGNRMVAVLDDSPGVVNDRVFMFNLESETSTFANGQPFYEFTPNDTTFFRRVWDESIAIASDGSGSPGGWVAYFNTTNNASSSTNIYPVRMFRMSLLDSTSGKASQVIPGPSPFDGINRLDRQMFVSNDLDTLCFIGSANSTGNDENVFAINPISSFGQSLSNLSGFPNPMQLFESNDVFDGTQGTFTFSPDDSTVAFARQDGTRRIPMIAKLDQSLAGQVPELIEDIESNVENGFDFTDFPDCREFYISQDNEFLVFFQGLFFSGSLIDRFDLFTVSLNSFLPSNLTRTYSEPEPTLHGPFDAQGFVVTTRSTIDPGGSFLSPNGDYWYWFRDRHSLPSDGPDVFNLIAVSVGLEPSTGDPSFRLTNVTGNEFEPAFNEPLPVFSSPSMIGNASAFEEGSASYHRIRRVGGDGPFRNFYYMVGRDISDLTVDGVDQLWLFDGDNPGPALLVTNFRERVDANDDADDLTKVYNGARISNVIPSQEENKVAFVLFNGNDPVLGDGTEVGSDMELLVADLNAFATLSRVPEDGSQLYGKLITDGSIHFLPSDPNGLLLAYGSVERQPAPIDGGLAVIDPGNPIDASPYFHRFDAGTTETIAPPPNTVPASDPPVDNRRAVMIFGGSVPE